MPLMLSVKMMAQNHSPLKLPQENISPFELSHLIFPFEQYISVLLGVSVE